MSARPNVDSADALITLTEFLSALSPRGTVRAAKADKAAGWLNFYPAELSCARVDAVRPVAMHLTYERAGVRLFAFVVFDLDAKGRTRAEVRADADRLAAAAQAAGIEVVVAESGPTGGVHVWMGCAEGVPADVVRRLAEAARAVCPSVDISPLTNAHTGAVRPPGAAHRKGGHSVLTSHSVGDAVRALGCESAPREAFERLADRLTRDAVAAGRVVPSGAGAAPAGMFEKVPPSIAARGPIRLPVTVDERGCARLEVRYRPLGPRAMAGLTRRHSEALSDQYHAPIRSMVLAGWTSDQGYAVACDPDSSPALEWIRTTHLGEGERRPHGEAERRRRWSRAWWLAVQDAARMPPAAVEDDRASGEAQAAAVDLLARMRSADGSRWSRPSGPSDWAMGHAIAFLMVQSGRSELTVDCRRLGVLMGRSQQTANVSRARMAADGWFEMTAPGDVRTGQAVRLTLATSHVCTDDPRHVCAVYDVDQAVRNAVEAEVAMSSVSPVHGGSDSSQNARPPALNQHLRAGITQRQAGLWSHLGHHAARTLASVTRSLGPVILRSLIAESAYVPATVVRHVHRLAALGAVALGRTSEGDVTVTAGPRSLYDAAQGLGEVVQDKTAHRAVAARVDQTTARWWAAEEAASRRPLHEAARRPGPDQTVMPGTDPYGRAYPRTTTGVADHARARRIEAERIDARGLLTHAVTLARRGELIDPPRLLAVPVEPVTTAPAPIETTLRRHCPECHAVPGEPCVTWHHTKASRPHAARRTGPLRAPTADRRTA